MKTSVFLPLIVSFLYCKGSLSFTSSRGFSRPAVFTPSVYSTTHYSQVASSSSSSSSSLLKAAASNGDLQKLGDPIARNFVEKDVAVPGSGFGLKSQILTFLRVGIPSLFAGVLATATFPAVSLTLASLMNDSGVLSVLSVDSSQFVQNFLSVSGLLFSILVGQTYYFMYQQQEAVYYALFNEVTEAKSLLEQVALVCQGRTMYKNVLSSMTAYVQNDLKRLKDDPAVLLSARPMDDPLESIMYMTSVGVPSSVYETVKSLRQARAGRLGALQRKLPLVHFILLWILAAVEISSFPLLGAGTQIIGGYNILTVEGVLFGVMTFGIVLTLRVVGELWRPTGSAYNVDGVLGVMVRGLEEELSARMAGGQIYAANRKSPSLPASDGAKAVTPPPTPEEKDVASDDLPVLKQGLDLGILLSAAKKCVKVVKRKS